MNGFFKLHYNIKRWEHWHNPNVLVTWIHLLARARWDKKPTRYKGVLIERGQLLMGYKELSKETGLSIQQTRTVINTLKSTGEITTKATNKGTIVTIEKYEYWQDLYVEPTSETTSELTTQQQPSNNPVTTQQQLNNKDNKVNNHYKDINKHGYVFNLKHKEWV